MARDPRNFFEYVRAVPGVHRHGLALCRGIKEFRHPTKVLLSYLRNSFEPHSTINLRNQLRFRLSSHPRDGSTVFEVFAKREYARTPPGAVVIDIGANIGVYAVHAALLGAKVVYAFEPSAEAFSVLKHNVSANGFEHIVKPFRFAVSDRDGDVVKFPTAASPHNRIGADWTTSLDDVPTITLDRIVEENRLTSIDMLKIDCEGSEYDILYGANSGLFPMIKCINVEYHEGRSDELIVFLEGHGFTVTRKRVTDPTSGTIWLTRDTSD